MPNKYDLSDLGATIASLTQNQNQNQYDLSDLGGNLVNPTSNPSSLADLGGTPMIPEADTAEPFIRDIVEPAKRSMVEIGKGMLRGFQGIVSGTGGLMDVLGQNLAVPEDKAKEIVSSGIIKDSDIKRRNTIAKKLSEWGTTAKDFWDNASQKGVAAPDPKIFSGTFMQNPSWTRGITAVAGAIPSLAAAHISSMATGNPGVGLAYLGMLEGEPIFAGAREAGVPLEKANKLFAASAIGTSVLESMPLGRFFRGGEGKVAKDMFAGAVQEGTEEIAQQFLNNFIEKVGFNKTKDLFEGMVESFLGGAGSGGVLGGLTSGRGYKLDQDIQDSMSSGANPEEIETMQRLVERQIISAAPNIEKTISENRTASPVPPATVENPPDIPGKGIVIDKSTGKPLEIIAKEAQSAKEIRSDTGQVPFPGVIPQAGKGEGGENIYQPEQEQVGGGKEVEALTPSQKKPITAEESVKKEITTDDFLKKYEIDNSKENVDLYNYVKKVGLSHDIEKLFDIKNNPNAYVESSSEAKKIYHAFLHADLNAKANGYFAAATKKLRESKFEDRDMIVADMMDKLNKANPPEEKYYGLSKDIEEQEPIKYDKEYGLTASLGREKYSDEKYQKALSVGREELSKIIADPFSFSKEDYPAEELFSKINEAYGAFPDNPFLMESGRDFDPLFTNHIIKDLRDELFSNSFKIMELAKRYRYEKINEVSNRISAIEKDIKFSPEELKQDENNVFLMFQQTKKEKQELYKNEIRDLKKLKVDLLSEHEEVEANYSPQAEEPSITPQEPITQIGKVPYGTASLKQDYQVKIPVPAKTPQDFKNRIDQLNKFAQGRAILRKGARLKKAAGLFQSIPKEGEIKLDQETLLNDKEYMSTLAHELGHALEFNVLGKTNNPQFKLFGENLDPDTLSKVREELKLVTHDLVGESLAKSRPGYYYRPAELIARYFEKMLASPGNLEEIAPTVTGLLNQQSIKHPIISEFLEAANEGIDKGAPKVVLLRDLKQTYEKHLGKRVGDIAFGEEMAYRAMKERGKIVLEKFIEEKFKGVKDAPDALFRAAEAIKISRKGVPDFGTRDFVTARTIEEEAILKLSGYEIMPNPVIEDGKAYPQYAKWRYTPKQAEELYNSLSPAGKKLILDFTAERNEAKDYFNREVIKDVNKIQGNIEGWVYHYFEGKRGSTISSGKKFKQRKAGTRRERTGAEGYVEDFKKAMTKVLIDLEGEKVYNDFIKRQFARVTRPLAEGQATDPGWVEVVGTIKAGVGLPQEKRMVVIDKGKSVPIKQTRYQMPQSIYERYKLWRGLVEEATTAVRIVNDINRYWRINILTYPGTATTNFIGGGVQYSAKILTDFYREVLTGDVKMPQTRRNIGAMIKVLMPKGWAAAPDWVYGGDLSNFYGQFMQQKSHVSQAIDEYGNKALKLFGTIERYWKKVILTADGVSDIASLNNMTNEGLTLPTEEERDIIIALNESVDLYGYDYDNVPFWLEAHQRSAMGQAIKPFAKYPYKYAKQVLDMVGSAFDQTQPWQDRVAKILALTTMVAAYAMLSSRRKKEQKTPLADPNLEIPARMQTRGRLFITTDEKGNELFVRVAKYPFINLTEAGMQLVNGSWEGAKDTISDMLGSIGPLGNIGLLAFNYRNKYNMYESVPVILGENIATFIPGYRVLNDISRMFDPYMRKQKTFGQTFTRIIPTTDKDLQKKLHGEIRTERVPIEGEIKGEGKGRRTTIDVEMETYWQDILLSMLSGIYVNRIDPQKAEAFIIRKTKNIEKREKRENKKQKN